MDDATTATTTGSDDGISAATHDRAREGIEHLQAAARELIEAARAALDVAEEVVNDPDALATLAGSMSTLGDVARRFTGTGGWPMPGDTRSDRTADRTADGSSDGSSDRHDGPAGTARPHGRADDKPRVERIRVTE